MGWASIVAALKSFADLVLFLLRLKVRREDEQKEKQSDDWNQQYQEAVARGDVDEINRLLAVRRRTSGV